MTTPNDPTMSHDSLDAVIAGYMLAVERGETPNRQELLDQHPEHADALRLLRRPGPDGLRRLSFTHCRRAGGHRRSRREWPHGTADRPLLWRLRAAWGDRRGWDKDRLQGSPGVAEPTGRFQDDPHRQLRLEPGFWSTGSARRRSPKSSNG